MSIDSVRDSNRWQEMHSSASTERRAPHPATMGWKEKSPLSSLRSHYG